MDDKNGLNNDQNENSSFVAEENIVETIDPSPVTSPPDKTKKIKKILKLVGGATGLVLLVTGILFALAYFLPNKTLESSFTIGDTTITTEGIVNYEKALNEYKNTGVELEEEASGLTLRQIAENDLIMNAGLKHYAKTKCDFNFTEADVLGFMEFPDGTTADSIPQAYRTRGENLFLKLKLSDCILTKKDVVEVATTVASSSYMLKDLSVEERSVKFKNVRDYMEQTIAPQLRSDTSFDGMSKYVDRSLRYIPNQRNIRLPGTWEEAVDHSNGQYKKTIIGSPVDIIYWTDYPGVTDCSDFAGKNANDEESLCPNDIFNKLTKEGQVSDVYATNDNFYHILRLEKIYGGEFNSWNAFLENLKDNYGYSSLSKISSYVKYLAIVSLDTVFGTNLVEAFGACPSCNTCYNIGIGFWTMDTAGGNIVAAKSPSSWWVKQNEGWGYLCPGSPEHQISGWNAYYTSGQVNCGWNLPQIWINSTGGYHAMTSYTGAGDTNYCPTISGWNISTKGYGSSHSIAGWSVNSSSTSISINNSSATVWVGCYYTPALQNYSSDFSISATTTADKTQIAPGETVTWTHTAKESAGKDVKMDARVTSGSYGDGYFIGAGTSSTTNKASIMSKPTANIYQYTNTDGAAPVTANKIECVIPDGQYKVAAAYNTGYALDISGGNAGGKAQMYQTSQTWTLSCDSSGFYTMVNVNQGGGSNKQVLAVSGSALSTLAGIYLSGSDVLAANSASAQMAKLNQYAQYAQQWRIVSIGSNKYQIYNRSGLALDMYGGINSLGNGQSVLAYTPNGTEAQEWKFMKNPTSISTEQTPVASAFSAPVGGAVSVTPLRASGTLLSKSTSYTATTADAGKKVCQLVRSNWTARNNFQDKDSTPACVTVQATTYTVTYNAGTCPTTASGNVPNSGTYNAGATVTVGAGTQKCLGHSFGGWKYNSTSTIYQASNTFSMPAANVTLTAQWDPIRPNVTVPTNTSGTSTVSSKVNASASAISIDYKGNSLNFVHTITVGTNLNIPNASTADSNYYPALQAGTKSGSITASSWEVSAATGPSAASTLPKQTGTATTTYNKTLDLTSSHIGQICQSAKVEPTAANVTFTPITNSGYTVGYNVTSASSGTAISSVCANVISKWTVTPSSKAENTTTNTNSAGTLNVKPYDNLKFTHTLTGNDHVLKDTSGSNVTVTGTVSQTGWSTFIGNKTLTAANSNGNASVANSFNVQPDDEKIGKTICQSVSVDKKQWNNLIALVGNNACVYIPYNYITVPDISGFGNSTTLEAGDEVTISKTLRVDPVQGTSPKTSYETKTMDGITERVVCYVNDITTNPCPGWDEASSVTTQTFRSDQSGQVGSSVTWQVPLDTTVGTKYCFYARTDDNGQVVSGINKGGTSSGGHCVSVTRGPTLQIHGAESWSGMNCRVGGATHNESGGFFAKTVPTTVGPFGQLPVSATWSQYGLFSAGNIDNGFGSGGHIYNIDNNTTALNLANALKFSQSTVLDNQGGRYLGPEDAHCITDFMRYYESRYPDQDGVSSTSLDGLLSNDANVFWTAENRGIVMGKAADNGVMRFGFSDSTLAKLFDSDHIIFIEGNISIERNIEVYQQYKPLLNINAIPNLVIIATGDIVVDPSVTRLDGVYFAGRTFWDCGVQASSQSVNFSITGSCRNPLIVNGAVIAYGMRFQRTYHGVNEAESNIYNPTPAEIINYTPAVWLREYALKRSLNSTTKTTFYRETAPRL